jgi:hypothetical protein
MDEPESACEDFAAVQHTRSFLSGPERFLRHLFDD